MTVLQRAMHKTGKTDYQLFYLAYVTAGSGEPVEDEFIQSMYALWQGNDILPTVVWVYCTDIMSGSREVDEKVLPWRDQYETSTPGDTKQYGRPKEKSPTD